MEQAKLTVMIDNDRVRVNEWRFAPRTETGWHVHEMNYVVVPTITGTLIIRSADDDFENNITQGQPYYRDAGAQHNVVNETDSEVAFIEIELK